jgi:hypothetical protein
MQLANRRKSHQSPPSTLILHDVGKVREVPLGKQVWADTQLHLPQGTHSTWREAITEQTISGSGAIVIHETPQ